jgi:hypothetical protein
MSGDVFPSFFRTKDSLVVLNHGKRLAKLCDNDPDALEENDELWSGIELSFAAPHIMNVDKRDENTMSRAAKRPLHRWRSL